MRPSTLNRQIFCRFHRQYFHQSLVLLLPCATDKRLSLFNCWILNVVAKDNTLPLLCLEIALIALVSLNGLILLQLVSNIASTITHTLTHTHMHACGSEGKG